MTKYRWVYHGDTRLSNVGILPDGTLHNPNNYPDDIVRTAVLAADARRHERRSQAAKRAAVTRSKRQERKVYAVAKALAAGGHLFPWHHCVICGRGLDDRQSIDRGIGSECWQGVLDSIERMRASEQPTAPELPLTTHAP